MNSYRKKLLVQKGEIDSWQVLDLIKEYTSDNWTLTDLKLFVDASELSVYIDTEKLCYLHQAYVLKSRLKSIDLDILFNEKTKEKGERLKNEILFESCRWFQSINDKEKDCFLSRITNKEFGASVTGNEIVENDVLGENLNFEDSAWLTAFDNAGCEVVFKELGYQKAIDFTLVEINKSLRFFSLSELVGTNEHGDDFIWHPMWVIYSNLMPVFKTVEVLKAIDSFFCNSQEYVKKETKKSIALDLIPKTIKELGFDPLAIPDNKGRPGVKKAVFDKLSTLLKDSDAEPAYKSRLEHVVETFSSFENRWREARKAGVIRTIS